jgi:hypothetical protein
MGEEPQGSHLDKIDGFWAVGFFRVALTIEILRRGKQVHKRMNLRSNEGERFEFEEL